MTMLHRGGEPDGGATDLESTAAGPEPDASSADRPTVAVLVPCLNEALTIADVVRRFARELPHATVYVFDNDSTDATAEEARRAGAVVVRVKRRGKGNVVAAMMDRVDADHYVLVDGDGTYPAEAVHELLAPLQRGDADMVVGRRVAARPSDAYRPLHVSGNLLVRWCINRIFGVRLQDIMSGYRAFTREVRLQLPVVASGFDVETELTLQLLYRRFVITEVPVPYGVRPEGSHSKLRTFEDGARVLLRIVGVFMAYRPLVFFGSFAVAFFAVGAFVGYFPIREYIATRWVGSVPKAILAAACMILSALSAVIAVLLHTINYRILETTAILVRQHGHGTEYRTRAGGR